MNLVDKQHVTLLQTVGEDGRQIAWFFNCGAGGHADVHAQFGGDNVRQRGLAQPRRPEQQRVVQRLLAASGGLKVHGQLVLQFLLTHVLGQRFGTQGGVERFGHADSLAQFRSERNGVGCFGFGRIEWGSPLAVQRKDFPRCAGPVCRARPFLAGLSQSACVAASLKTDRPYCSPEPWPTHYSAGHEAETVHIGGPGARRPGGPHRIYGWR